MKRHTRLDDRDRARLRNWKRWGAYLAECEWALMYEVA
jgi:hypothetical protein